MTDSQPTQPELQLIAMSGPTSDAEREGLAQRRLNEQMKRGYIGLPDRSGTNRYGVPSPSPKAESLGSTASGAAATPAQSSWLQGIGVNVTVGTRVWFSQGKLGYNYAAIGGPDVQTEFLWQGQNTKIYEVKADLVIRRFVSTMAFGWGNIDKGTLRTQDFGSNSRTDIIDDQLSSRTDGYVWYGSIDLGPRLLHWQYKGEAGALDLLVGFQYWREKYTARGLTILLDPVLPTGTTSNADVVTTRVTWQIIRLGPRIAIPVFPRLTARGHVFYIPWSHYENEDFHHLLPPGANGISFLDKASGGEGIELEAALQVRIWRNLDLEGGYRYWDLRSGDGTSQSFVPGIPEAQLNAAKARRQGIFFGLDWTF